MPFIPHTEAETQEMLRIIGVASIEELFDEIPNQLLLKELPDLPDGMNEFAVKQLMAKKLSKDNPMRCFLGAGAYEHHIPAVVNAMLSRGEYLTAYTPYQAEASQGNLQVIYEFQTMIASLMGLDVANASVYDGSNALAESLLMSIRVKKQKEKIVLIPRSVHPAYRRVAKSILRQQKIDVIEVGYDRKSGQVDMSDLQRYENKNIAALVIPQPNFFGVLEEVDVLTDWAHQQGAMAVALVNPIATSLLREPGQWGTKGADIACGEGQPLGISLTFGGPYFGFMACKMEYVRQMPGRIVGRTVDIEGKQGFTLTLQAREQHIRRAKATSNICTNQGLMVTGATIYMSLLGAQGLRQVASASHFGAAQLLQTLQDKGAGRVFSGPIFHEFVIDPGRPVAALSAKWRHSGIQGGYALGKDYPELSNHLLVCVTETKTQHDLGDYCDAF